MNGFQKKLRQLVGVNVALAVLILLGIVFSPASAKARSTKRDLLANAGVVATIRIDGPESIELVKSGTDWLLRSADGDLPADGPRVQAFMKAVDAVQRMDPVAKDSASWPSLGLKGEASRHVAMADSKGTTVCDFTVGRYATAPNAVYVAVAGSAEAFSVNSGMASYVQGPHASWLDLKAWLTPPAVEAVQEIELHGSVKTADGRLVSDSYTITRSGSGWKTGATVLDSQKVEAMIRAVAAIRGDDYMPQSAAPATTATSVVMRLGNGRSLQLDIEHPQADGRYPATSSQRTRRLYLPAWVLTEALKPLAELLPTKS
jgi:hypothetical protein